jgi:hypothetical protein
VTLVLSTLEKLTNRLYTFRRPYCIFGAIVFSLLAFLEFKGTETAEPFMMSFLWFFFIALFVDTFRDNTEELASYEGYSSKRVERIFQSKGFKVYAIVFFLFSFSMLVIFTVEAL